MRFSPFEDEPKVGAERHVRRFALLPVRRGDGVWLWLERYIATERLVWERRFDGYMGYRVLYWKTVHVGSPPNEEGRP